MRRLFRWIVPAALLVLALLFTLQIPLAISATPTPHDQTDHEHLVLGDGQYSTDAPMLNGLYICHKPRGGGGAVRAGEWINDDGTWNPDEKPFVQGEVDWPDAQVSITLEGETRRVIITNGLPDHPTGIFPVSTGDPAYSIDPNPNAIEAQQIELTLPAMPTLADEPACLPMGPIAVMNNGVMVFHPLDVLGRDAVAWEIQDQCSGHPERDGIYHYHGHIRCVEDVEPGSGHSERLGFALDGFGLYGQYGEDGEALNNADLDECHGHTHLIEWDGEQVEMYHYHLTEEYPYTLGCYRGTPVTFRSGDAPPRRP